MLRTWASVSGVAVPAVVGGARTNAGRRALLDSARSASSRSRPSRMLSTRPPVSSPHPSSSSPSSDLRTQHLHNKPASSPAEEEEEEGDLVDRALYFVNLSKKFTTAPEFKKHAAHITSLILQLRPINTGPLSKQYGSADKACLILFKNALECLQRVIALGEPFRDSTLAALMTAATRTIQDQKALFEALLGFVRTVQLIRPSTFLSSGTTDHMSNIHGRKGPSSAEIFTQRILSSLITALGKAGLPHLGERLIQESASTDGQPLAHYMQSIGLNAPRPPSDPKKSQLQDPDRGTSHQSPQARKSALHAYDILILAERRRKSCIEDPQDPSNPLPDMTRIRLGPWSTQPNVWAALVGARLEVGDENGADVWLNIYRALVHHKRWLSHDDEEVGGGEKGDRTKWLPDPSPRPYLLRAQTRVPHSKPRKYVYKKIADARAKEPDLVAPYQTVIVREMLRHMQRDAVPLDMVFSNFLIGFEASCERLGDALDLVERTLRMAGRAVSSSGKEDGDEQGSRSRDGGAKEESSRLLEELGPGFLASLAEIHIRRSKILARMGRDMTMDNNSGSGAAGGDLAERERREFIASTIFTPDRHPVAHYFCAQSPGETLALWLEFVGIERGDNKKGRWVRAGDRDEDLSDVEVEAGWATREKEDPADEEEEEEEDGKDLDEDLHEEAGVEDATSTNEHEHGQGSEPSFNRARNTRRRPPMRLQAWTRRYLSSLLSAPAYEYPHALLLLEQLDSRQAGLYAVGYGLVTDVLAALLRSGHTHVLRHFKEKDRERSSEEGGGEESPRMTFSQESNERESVTTVTLERKVDSSISTSVQQALHSSTHIALITHLLSSASLAELKYTARAYLELAAESQDGQLDTHTLEDGSAFHSALKAVARAKGGVDGVPPLGVEWARNLVLDTSREVGGQTRVLASRLWINEGPLESQVQEEVKAEAWDEETRAELLEIIMERTSGEVQMRRESLRKAWPTELLGLLEMGSDGVKTHKTDGCFRSLKQHHQ
ncbi:hypothetical protein A4X09_0g5507 [Tilletia walkeri]|uniref:Uncharacterized protein n=1 Tax=Tilletia walkeri TaxID=117179 RepID=A0A8X7N4D2_9BASI|nr:hypothetical protein A4X09_0g5507 [Tilletia walkeri]